jgi:hypothetical protein
VAHTCDYAWHSLARSMTFPIERRSSIYCAAPIPGRNKLVLLTNRNTLPFSKRRHSLFVSYDPPSFVRWKKSKDDILSSLQTVTDFVHWTIPETTFSLKNLGPVVLSIGQYQRRHSLFSAVGQEFCPLDKRKTTFSLEPAAPSVLSNGQ